MAHGGIPLSEWSGSGATRELHETIKLQIAATDRQSRIITRLTVFMAILAVIQTFATVVQVIPLFQNHQDRNANANLCNTAEKLHHQESKMPSINQTPVNHDSLPITPTPNLTVKADSAKARSRLP